VTTTAPKHVSPDNPNLFRPGAYDNVFEYLKATWDSRELIVVLSNARLNSKNAGNHLGRAWLYLEPALQISVYALVFGVGLRLGQGVDGFVSWLAVGQIVFGFSQRAITSSAVSIDNNRGMLGAFAFPRLVLPAATTLFTLRLYVNSIVPVGVAVLAQGFRPSLTWLLMPFAIVAQALFNFGAGAFVARIGESLPDVAPALAQLFRLLFFTSMVLFPASRFEDSDHWAGQLFYNLLPINPFYAYIHIVRRVLLGYESPHFGWILISATVWTVSATVAGIILFFRAEGLLGAARVRR